MSTTQVFVELLITGFGGLIWMTIMVGVLCGLSLETIFTRTYPAFFILPISGIAYIVGILIDRIGYQVFMRLENRIGYRTFNAPENNEDKPKKEAEAYLRPAITLVMHHSGQLKEKINYTRTRLRLCRSWIVNFSCIGLALALALLAGRDEKQNIILALLFLSLFLSLASYFVWKRLALDYYIDIKTSYQMLKKNAAVE